MAKVRFRIVHTEGYSRYFIQRKIGFFGEWYNVDWGETLSEARTKAQKLEATANNKGPKRTIYDIYDSKGMW